MRCNHLNFLCIFLLLISGCAPLKPHVGELVDRAFGYELMSDWMNNAEEVYSVQGIARAKITSPDQNGTLTQVVLAEQPNHFRVEILSPFGAPLLLLTANGNALSVLLPSRNEFYIGSASPRNLARFIRLPLESGSLVDLMLYQVPLISDQIDGTYRLPKGGWEVQLTNLNRRQLLRFNPNRQLVEVSYFDRQQEFLRVAYSQIGELVTKFPAQLEIELPELQINAVIDFTEQTVNRSYLPDIFMLSPPEGTTVIELND